MSDTLPIANQAFLFDSSEFPPTDEFAAEPSVKPFDRPVWTDNKAHFIMRYLRYFVFITKHGTYIDGFAGPQEENMCDTWAAKLVLESEPKWMRHFHLCDDSRSQVNMLRQLKEQQPASEWGRNIEIYHGDFNAKLDEILSSGDITEKEATFCLLDQRTFECHWRTVEKLAMFKTTGHKIELFYFLANGWLERALHAQKDLNVLEEWWGRDDWTELRMMSREERRDVLVSRFKRELGYQSVKAWPIYERENGGAVMYYMLHATDHPEAPILMSRAYRNTVSPLEPVEQLNLALLPHPQTATASVRASQLQHRRR